MRAAATALAMALLVAGCAHGPRETVMAPATDAERQRAQQITQEPERAAALTLLGTPEGEEARLGGLGALLREPGQLSGGVVALGKSKRRKRAQVQVTPPTFLRGQGSRGDLYSATRKRVSSARYCYERQLRHDPKLAGEIRLRYTINAQGRVTQIKVLDNSVQSTVGSCLLRVIKRTRFSGLPNAQAEVEVEQSWAFQPR